MRTLPLFALPAAACIGGMTVDYGSAEDELMKNVEEIRQAEIAVQVIDDFLACGDEAAAKASASQSARAWDGPDCFARLGWEPTASVRGGYFVTVSPDKQDFQVIGVADVDGDGSFMRVEATKASPASRTSAEGVQ